MSFATRAFDAIQNMKDETEIAISRYEDDKATRIAQLPRTSLERMAYRLRRRTAS